MVKRNNDGMDPKLIEKAMKEARMTAQDEKKSNDPDAPAENSDVVNAANIQATLRAAISYLQKYNIPLPTGAEALSREGLNGLTVAQAQALFDQLAGAERSASGTVVQRESTNLLKNLLPMMGRNNDNGIA